MNPKSTVSPRPIPLNHVKIYQGFWEDRQTINRDKTIPSIYTKLKETGRIDAWDLNPNRERPKKRSVIYMFFDSDSGKWLEAVGYSLKTHPDPLLEKQADELIGKIEKAQQADGYLNSYFPNLEPENKWRNLRDWHEMYNAGHLIEGAVAYYQATGKRTLLDVLSRFADHIDSHFGPEEDKKHGYPGHPELEMALVKLYRETQDKRYLDLSTYFINERGKEPHYFDKEAAERGENKEDFWAQSYRYCQAHEPIREQETATGHSVRACYLYAGLADIALETGDRELFDASVRLWDDLTQHQMYVTGGLGPAHSNEGFTFAYDLPNETAYAETCASIALAFWAHRMFHLDPHGRYIDVMERAIYNGSLSGVSYDGTQFFYANPLAAYPNVNPVSPWVSINSEDKHYRREDWFFCPCCPPNLARLVASIGDYFYSSSDTRLYVHLYNDSSSQIEIANQSISLDQETNYPYDDKIKFTLHSATSVNFELALRIPGWCYAYELTVNGESQSVKPEDGYVILSRTWNEGDTITLDLAMPVERILPHPSIRQNAGQVALQRGPLVYCLEEVDNGKHLANVVIPQDAELKVEFDHHLFGGVAVITGDALRVEPAQVPTDMYAPQSRLGQEQTPFNFKAIPYFLWANREAGEMRVWIRSGL